MGLHRFCQWWIISLEFILICMRIQFLQRNYFVGLNNQVWGISFIWWILTDVYAFLSDKSFISATETVERWGRETAAGFRWGFEHQILEVCSLLSSTACGAWTNRAASCLARSPVWLPIWGEQPLPVCACVTSHGVVCSAGAPTGGIRNHQDHRVKEWPT